jgi:hypothetical protein
VLAEALGVNCLAFVGEAGSPERTKRDRGRPPKTVPAIPSSKDLEAEAKAKKKHK